MSIKLFILAFCPQSKRVTQFWKGLSGAPRCFCHCLCRGFRFTFAIHFRSMQPPLKVSTAVVLRLRSARVIPRKGEALAEPPRVRALPLMSFCRETGRLHENSPRLKRGCGAQGHGHGVSCCNRATGLVLPPPFKPPRHGPWPPLLVLSKEGSLIAEFRDSLARQEFHLLDCVIATWQETSDASGAPA